MNKKDLTEKDEKRLKKVIDESVKISLFNKLMVLKDSHPNDAEFGEKARKFLSYYKKIKY